MTQGVFNLGVRQILNGMECKNINQLFKKTKTTIAIKCKYQPHSARNK